MDDQEVKKLLEDGARAVEGLNRLDRTLKDIIQEHEALIEMQGQMTQALRDLQAGADRIRKGCDSFNAEMERRGITSPPIEETRIILSLEQWDPKKTDLVN